MWISDEGWLKNPQSFTRKKMLSAASPCVQGSEEWLSVIEYFKCKIPRLNLKFRKKEVEQDGSGKRLSWSSMGHP